ncbi:hypothetical protein FW778_22180 [Ginsengibacter hankyongi]|uniref:YhhN-like protein n=1 Tax=Ginsengibacter hankyongi TaxID=2607284 RepID=A0A5J5IBR0_9BACT|nr:hypothetical protein [Ginsengibacter hankyongi]KAA9034547.1 hypothetical protein FW778_22180 [Ginsengibacter hankyongi]
MTPLESFFKNFLEPLSYFVYALVFLLKINRQRSLLNGILFAYYAFAASLLLFASIIAMAVDQADNTWMYNIFYLVTICVLSYYFHGLLITKTKKATVTILLVTNVVIFIWHDVFSGHFFKAFNDQEYAICFISIVMYALLYFDQLLRNVTEQDILFQFDFWLVSGYLVYFLGSFIIILFYRSVDIDDSGNVWALQNIILFLSSVVTLAGYLKIPSPKRMY